jgi:hypothetical protein
MQFSGHSQRQIRVIQRTQMMIQILIQLMVTVISISLNHIHQQLTVNAAFASRFGNRNNPSLDIAQFAPEKPRKHSQPGACFVFYDVFAFKSMLIRTASG